jgi:hypothetical protein
MSELTIKYKNKRTLDALLEFAKYFDFSIILPSKSKGKISEINGVSIIRANNSIDTSELETIFSTNNFDAKEIREKAWKRKK